MQLPSLTEIQGLKTKQLIDKLRSNLDISEKSFRILEEQEIKGRTFLDLTQEELERCGMALGPAKEIVKYIDQLKGIRK
jgi:hypothetical protein